MNFTEEKAKRWLDKKGIVATFQRRASPDFITDDVGYEVKLIRDNAITFYESQIEQLRQAKQVIVLVFNLKDDDPIAEISFEEMEIPGYYKRFRLCLAQTTSPFISEFICQDCGGGFLAPQGSRRRYCPECLAKRVQAGKKIEEKNVS